MPTLREEVKGPAGGLVLSTPPSRWSDGWNAGIAEALGKYGDWQVVEGKLGILDCRAGRDHLIYATSCDDIVLHGPGTEGAQWTLHANLGRLGDHVKLIIPPREPRAVEPRWHPPFTDHPTWARRIIRAGNLKSGPRRVRITVDFLEERE